MEIFSPKYSKKIEQEEYKFEKPQIKEGVNFVFEQHSKLAEIGTKEQYTEYLETIFPESKVKDIVYHKSRSKIENFREGMFGIYFSYSPIQSGYGDTVNSVILNVKSILIRPKPEDSIEQKLIYDNEYRNYNNPSFLLEGNRVYKYDSSIEGSTVTKEGIQIKVRSPEQIHILGSNQDIEGFKKFTQSGK
jgi:hypothetical protein